MIIGITKGDIFGTPYKHIAFAVNTEGFNDSGFAGVISRRYWSKLANNGGNELGEILTKEVGGKVFHALVCHSLGKDGWKQTPEIVEKCLDLLNLSPDGETLAIVLMGAGMIGQMQGADVLSILGAMARSNKQVEVYYL